MRTKKNPRALVSQKPGAPALLGKSLSPTPPRQDPEGLPTQPTLQLAGIRVPTGAKLMREQPHFLSPALC